MFGLWRGLSTARRWVAIETRICVWHRPVRASHAAAAVRGEAAEVDASFLMDERDHRSVGRALDLFMIHPMAPGMPFMLPHGMRIFQRLQDHLREICRREGYDEISSPQVFSSQLFDKSGHNEHYSEDMIFAERPSRRDEPADVEGGDALQASQRTLALKPMNCPGHCLVFSHLHRSERHLPLRFSEFGALHRNEAAGGLAGLTRARRFHQDDAHIFCTREQVTGEIASLLTTVVRLYEQLGFASDALSVALSTRPTDSFAGTLEEWESAEASLKTALEHSGHAYSIKDGDGAFYGPKIDIAVTDAAGRQHQTATIQLDFQLPRRFDLKYTPVGHHPTQHSDTPGPSAPDQRPVMIHRALVGSLERMMGILLEQNRGKLPLFLSPRQCAVLSVSPDATDYARSVAFKLRANGFFVEMDLTTDRLSRKIARQNTLRTNVMACVGTREAQAGTVSVREHNTTTLLPLDEFVDSLLAQIRTQTSLD